MLAFVCRAVTLGAILVFTMYHLCVFPVFWCEAVFRSACKSLNQQQKRMNCFQWLKADTTKHFQDIITEHFHSSAAIGLQEFEFLLVVILQQLGPLWTQTHGSDLCGTTTVLRDIWLRCSSGSGPKQEGKVTDMKCTSTTVELFSVFSTFIMALLVVFLFYSPLWNDHRLKPLPQRYISFQWIYSLTFFGFYSPCSTLLSI